MFNRRTIAAMLLAPVPATLVSLGWYSFAAPTNNPWLGVLLIGYVAMLLVGWPLANWLVKRQIQTGVAFMLAGGGVALLGILSVMVMWMPDLMLRADFWADADIWRSLAAALLAGAATYFTFWLIAVRGLTLSVPPKHTSA
jgi:hypothetical protein